MNVVIRQEVASKAGWDAPKRRPENADADLIERWLRTTGELQQIAAENGWSKSEVARRADVATGTFSGWYDGTYKGRYDTTTAKLENFIRSFKEATAHTQALPIEPGFVQTRLARELFDRFTYAQALPTMAAVRVSSGLGKSMAAAHYAATRPHVFHVPLSPSSRSPHMLKEEICQHIGISSRNPRTMKAEIVRTLRRDGFSALLIVDEAQNLDVACINELRYFLDIARCGIVLLGNDQGTIPYRDGGQLERRVGRPMIRTAPFAEDIETILDAWGLLDPAARDVARKVAGKRGHYGVLTETIKMAAMIASGEGRGITEADLRVGFELRSTEDLK